MFPTLTLPAELRACVFASVKDQQDLAHLNASCKLLHHETQHLLYRSPKLKASPAFSLFERTLSENPLLALQVEKICYEFEATGDCPAGSPNLNGQGSQVINGLSHLEEFEFFSRKSDWDSSVWTSHFGSARHRLHTLWPALFWTAVGQYGLLSSCNVHTSSPLRIRKCGSFIPAAAVTDR